MYEQQQQQQQLFDLQDNNDAFDNGADPSSWLSHETPRIDSFLSVAPTGNVDPSLFNDLVQIVPLVQSLIDRKAKASFSRRGSMTYTKMPSRESLYKKVKLADKKAAVEKLEWEATTSSNEVERLQEDVDRVQGEISSFMQFVQALTENDSRGSAEEYDVFPYLWDQNVEIDNLNEKEMQKLEEAREAYIAAVVAVKENQDEAYLSAAATARSYLQSLVLRT